MKCRNLLRSALDGIVQAIGLVCLSAFVTSELAADISLRQLLLISASGAILLAVVYLLLLIKESSNKMIILFSLVSIFSFVICATILFAVHLTFPINIFYVRELNNADGILLLFSVGGFVLFSAVLRFCVFISFLIKNIHRSKADRTFINQSLER